MGASPEPNQIEELKRKVARERTARREALKRLKATVQRTVEDAGHPATPSSSAIKLPPNPQHTPDPDALETAKAQRKSGLNVLKATTERACHEVRETVFMDSRQLAARLSASDEAPVED